MGEKHDFTEIYGAYHPKLVRYLTKLVGEADAEDLTQEAFVKIDRGLADFRGDSSLSTWIYRIATNVARDRLRSAAHKQGLVTESALEMDLIPVQDHGSILKKQRTLEEVTIRKEMNI